MGMAFRALLFGALLTLLLGLSMAGFSWKISVVLLAKGLAVTNFLALLGLFSQRRGYRKLLMLEANMQDDVLFLWGFLACATLFFGVAESFSAAALSVLFRKIARSFRPFTGLQMFSQLPEATALFAFGSIFAFVSPLPVIVLQQALLLRLMFGGGLGKLRGNWLTGQAMSFHYWTQPLPNWLSRTFHLLPPWLHGAECFVTLAIEGPLTALLQVLPFRPFRVLAAFLYTSLLIAINVTGCFGHLGLLSLVQVMSLIDDSLLGWLEPFLARSSVWSFPVLIDHVYATSFALLAISPYVGASLVPLFQTVPSKWADRIYVEAFWDDAEVVHSMLEGLFVLGKYVKFASVTTQRFEIIVQAKSKLSDEFVDWPNLYKPCNVNVRPPLFVWLLPGVDWQLWFVGLAIDNARPAWLDNCLVYLLNQDPDVTALFGACPVEDLAAVRCAVFDYRFIGDPAGARFDDRGAFWARSFIKLLGPTLRKTKELKNLD